MKKIPNFISGFRIIISFILVFLTPFQIPFMILYILGGISDVLDGAIARKWRFESKLGARLDSLGDFLFFGVAFVKIISFIQLDSPIWIGILLVFILRIINLGIGFIHYHKLAILHTIFNKVTGIGLFLMPFLYFCLKEGIVIVFISLAFVASFEETLILILNPVLNLNVLGIWDLERKKR